MLSVNQSLPSFPQLMESLGHPEERPLSPTFAASSTSSSTSASAWRNPPAVIDDDAASDTRSTTSSRSTRTSQSPVIPSRSASQLAAVDGQHQPRSRKSRSPPSGGIGAKENVGVGRGGHRFAPYQGRAAGVPSINIDKANKSAEKALPTPPISQSLRRANRPQPLALAPKSNNPDIAPAPISALLRAHIARSSSSAQGEANGLQAPHTASPRISGHHVTHAPRSPMRPMTPVSIPTLPPNLPISPISAQFGKEAYARREVEVQREREREKPASPAAPAAPAAAAV